MQRLLRQQLASESSGTCAADSSVNAVPPVSRRRNCPTRRNLNASRTQSDPSWPLFSATPPAKVSRRGGPRDLTAASVERSWLPPGAERWTHVAGHDCRMVTFAVGVATLAGRASTMATDQAPGQLGVLLQRHRVAAGLSQEELAERAGLSRRGISDLERGARRAPHPATLRRITEALNLDQAERAALLASIP